jgi:DNA-binding response OmpR family regulator
MRVLLIEDEPAVARFLSRGLSAHGYHIAHAETGDEGLALSSDPTIEFVVLDLSLPGPDGLQVLSHLRRTRPGLPVLVLTARDDTPSKVQALDSGADDYLTKPFDFEELIARIRALRRRADRPSASRMELGDLTIDLLTRRVQRGQQEIQLSSREFALLEYFARHVDHVLSREQILSAVWEYDFEPESNVVDVYVGYLRRKLSPRNQPSLIQAVRGVGYRFVSAEVREPAAARY